VRAIVRAGVHHDDAAAPQHIAVGAAKGHRAGIGRHDAENVGSHFFGRANDGPEVRPEIEFVCHREKGSRFLEMLVKPPRFCQLAGMSYRIAALYRFVTIDDLPTLRRELLDMCLGEGACGTLLIASEGINGTIAAAPDAIERVVDLLDARLGVRQGEVKFSQSSEKPFRRMKVRIRPEIITMRAPEANPALKVGTYVAPRDWNAVISDPDVVLVDTRNTYETRIGTFRGAVDPGIESFTQFKRFVATELDPSKHRKVAMFCTGGIRCEKASAYMLAEGFEEVFHLKGGILQYLEDVAAEDSLWDGDCYVFDGRVAVGQGLAEAQYTQCFGCGAALTPEETQAPSFEPGVSCPHCRDRLTQERAEGLRLRHAERTRLPG